MKSQYQKAIEKLTAEHEQLRDELERLNGQRKLVIEAADSLTGAAKKEANKTIDAMGKEIHRTGHEIGRVKVHLTRNEVEEFRLTGVIPSHDQVLFHLKFLRAMIKDRLSSGQIEISQQEQDMIHSCEVVLGIKPASTPRRRPLNKEDTLRILDSVAKKDL